MVIGAFVRAGCAAWAGVALGLAFDPFGFWIAAPLAVAAATVLFADGSATTWQSLGRGYAFGIGFLGVHVWWLTASIAFSAWLIVVLVEALWFCATALLVRWASSSRFRLMAWPVAWVAPEVLRGRVPFGGFPWGQLGFSTIDNPWAAALPYLSVTGVSLLVATVGSSVALVVIGGQQVSRLRLGAVPAVLVLLSLIPTVVPYSPSITGSTSVAVVQSGVPGDGTDVATYGAQITRATADATVALAASIDEGEERPVDLVVWAENSTSTDPFETGESRAEITRAVQATGRPLLVGALVDGPSPQTLFNRTVLWLPSGPTGRFYTKAHPVPFGEYIPFRGLLAGISSQLNAVPRDTLPGTNPVPLQVGSLRLAMAICFDIAFDEPLADQVRQGAGLIVVQTSNATFTGTTQPDQQFAISRARALETGRSVVVASLNGRSGVISGTGEVLDTLPVEQAATLVASVKTSDSLTPAVSFGRFLDFALLGMVALLVGFAFRRRGLDSEDGAGQPPGR